MPKRMITLKLDPERASVAAVREKLGLQPAQIDESFGVIDVSRPEESLYAVMVDEDVAETVAGLPDVEGPHSDPKIEPFDSP